MTGGWCNTDEVKIQTDFGTRVIEILLERFIRKKFNLDISFVIQNLNIQYKDDIAHMTMNLEGIATKKELLKILKEEI